MKPLFMANAGPAKVLERGKKYVCVPNEPLEKEDLDRTIRGLSGRKEIPHPVVNPRGMCNFDRNMRLEVSLKKDTSTVTISSSTKVFGRNADEVNVYVLYRENSKDKLQELVFQGGNTDFSRMCLFIIDDGLDTPTWFISDDRPPVADDMPPACVLISEIEDEYNILPIAQWSLELDRDKEAENNPFLIPTKVSSEYIDRVENGRSLLALPAPVTPRLAEVSQIPNVKQEVFDEYKMDLGKEKVGGMSRAQLIIHALTPMRDQKYIDKHVNDFVVAVCPDKDSKDSRVEVEGMGVPLNRHYVERMLLNVELCNQQKNIFVGRITKEENVALLTAVIDKLPGTSFSVVSKEVLEIPKGELK
jgi:hypothetical protein